MSPLPRLDNLQIPLSLCSGWTWLTRSGHLTTACAPNELLSPLIPSGPLPPCCRSLPRFHALLTAPSIAAAGLDPRNPCSVIFSDSPFASRLAITSRQVLTGRDVYSKARGSSDGTAALVQRAYGCMHFGREQEGRLLKETLRFAAHFSPAAQLTYTRRSWDTSQLKPVRGQVTRPPCAAAISCSAFWLYT